MSERPKLRVIGAFAPEFAEFVCGWLADIRRKDFDVELLPHVALSDNKNTKIVQFKGDWKSKPAIPLVVCEDRETLKRLGVLCPYEFIIDRSNSLPVVNEEWKKNVKDENIVESGRGNNASKAAGRQGKQAVGGLEQDEVFLSNPVQEFKNRIDLLLALYPGGITGEDLRDWFAGLFRRYMCLDETVHGTSNLIDLDNLDDDDGLIKKLCEKEKFTKEDEDVWLYYRRFRGQPLSVDPMCACQELLNTLFGVEIAAIRDAFEPQNYKNRLKSLIGIYEKCRDKYVGRNPYPRPLGDRARYVTPTGMIDVLVIDDEPDKINERIKERIEAGNSIKDEKASIQLKSMRLCAQLFNFQPLKVVSGSKTNVFELAKEAFNRIREQGLSFDLVLVDLCLGDETGGDLSGYRMIRFVKQFYPDVPVVVYSKFRDMDHIARAFECGARWFLVKGEEDKLPRHVLRMLRQSGWHREWRAAQNHFKPIFLPKPESDSSAFIRKFHRTDAWKYLTYKSLEFYPGRLISVKKMGGGISSAVTFKAVKGIKLDGEYLQSPSIIKIDNAHNAIMEYERYFRYIRPYIANQVGRVEQRARILNRDTASIVYTFAGHPDSEHTLDSMSNALESAIRYDSSCDYERFRKALDEVFDEILPRIHRITPAREFGNAENTDCHSGVVEPADPKYSAYPNASFNEYERNEFYKSYVMRMQPWWTIDVDGKGVDFLPQPKYDVPISKQEEKSHGGSLVFHGVFRDNSQYVIEAYDNGGKLGWLKGLKADHVARYRRVLSPGKTLWLSNLKLKDTEAARERGEYGEVDKQDYREVWLSDMFKDASDEDLGLLHSEMGNDRRQYPRTIVDLQDNLLTIAKEVGRKLEHAKPTGERVYVHGCEFGSPVGIVHGDLNFGNIMLESRRQDPPAERPDERWRMTDVWLIDFARSRRDLITHDFNVAFTATLSLLVEKNLVGDKAYCEQLENLFPTLVMLSFTDPSKSLADIPNVFKDAPRFAFVYRILRRIRFAALKAGVSHHMYLLTSALACAYTFKIFLNRKKYIETSAMLAAMKICYKLLIREMVIVDDDFKNKLKSKLGDKEQAHGS